MSEEDNNKPIDLSKNKVYLYTPIGPPEPNFRVYRNNEDLDRHFKDEPDRNEEGKKNWPAGEIVIDSYAQISESRVRKIKNNSVFGAHVNKEANDNERSTFIVGQGEVLPEHASVEPDTNCRPGISDGEPDEMKRAGNNKGHRTKIKRRAIAVMVKKSKRRNRK